VGKEDGTALGHMIADHRAESSHDGAAEIVAKEPLRRALENLSDRQRRVLVLRYGLAGERPHALDEISGTTGVTREHVR
jgi:RNA polymerase primary sigma factor